MASQQICEEDAVIQQLRESRTEDEQYFDVHFGGLPAALYKDEEDVPPYDANMEEPIVWLRPGELCRDPQYFVDGAIGVSGCVVEGRNGDGWLLGAMAALWGHPEYLIENLFGSDPDDFQEWGVYTCRFYREGSWVEVCADTRMPALSGFTASEGEEPTGPQCLYGRCVDPREQWVQLLEKAYAKVLGSYEALSKGSVTEALVDLTGGSGEEITLNEDSAKKTSTLFEECQEHLENKHVLCATADPANNGQGGVPSPDLKQTALGLLPGHAYGVMQCIQVEDKKLVRLRNPWSGRGGTWKGPWADSSSQWEDFPEVLDECLKQASGWTREEDGIDQTDGSFFMEFSDFCSKFDTLHLCRLFDDKQYKQYKVLSSWAGKTAAGPDEGVPINADTGFAKLISEKAKPRTDKDACWFNNPQFRVEVKHKSTTHISLLQGPPKSGERFELCLEIIREKKTPALPGRVWERGDVYRSTLINQPVMREVSLSNVLLEPGYTYCVVARAATERGREAPFALRVFSPRELVLQPLDECDSSYTPGSWNGAAEVDSAGGAPFHLEGDQLIPNPTFRQSPQYFLNLPEPPADHPKATTGEVNVTLVLRRTDPTPDKAQKAQIGLCVFRGPAPEVVLGKKHKKTGPKVNALGEKPKGKPSTLKKKRRQAAQLLDGLAGPQHGWDNDLRSEDSITTAPKKIGLYPNEWHRLSSFGNETVAVLHLPTLVRSKFPHGLVITPCLSERGISGQYVLELHADCPTTLEAIAASKSKTLAGEWTARHAGGSHLQPSWSTNPIYRVRFADPTARPRVRVDLTRPAEYWNSSDVVGRMMGFYIHRADGPNGTGPSLDPDHCIMHVDPNLKDVEPEPYTQSPFTPLHTVQTPQAFRLDKSEDPYLIVPATYAPGQTGPFFLSVTSDVDFTLTAAQGCSVPAAPAEEKE